MEFILPAVLGAVAAMVLGMFWYSPKGFGKTWMVLVGITPEKMKNPINGVSMPVGMLLGFEWRKSYMKGEKMLFECVEEEKLENF